MAKVFPLEQAPSEIDLSYCGIDDTAIKAIIPELKAIKAITHLNLSNNVITDNGAKALAEVVLAEAAKTNPSIISLNLEDNKIGEEGKKALADAMENNITITGLLLNNQRVY